MFLASAAEIRETFGFDQMPDINAAIIAALHAAEADLNTILQTDFNKQTSTDTFYVPYPGLKEGGFVQTDFLLKRGLLVGAPTVVMANGLKLFGTDDQVVLTSDVEVDLEKGVVKDWTTDYFRQYVKIGYTTGFDVSATDEDSYNLDQVPKWLQEVAKLKAMIYLADSPVLTSAQIKLDVPVLAAQLRNSVQRRNRYAPTALLPM